MEYTKDLSYVNKKLKQLSIEFCLDYNKEILKINFISKQDYSMLLFLNSSPDFNKFGKTLKSKINNIANFYNSKEFKEGSEGAFCTDIDYRINVAKRIKNKIIRERILKKLNKIKKIKVKHGKIAVVISNNWKPEKIGIHKFRRVIHHELIHMILEYNGLVFRNDFGEGVCIYLQYFLGTSGTGNLNFLEKIIKDNKNKENNFEFERIVIKYIPMLTKTFKGKETPIQKKDSLIYLRNKYGK